MKIISPYEQAYLAAVKMHFMVFVQQAFATLYPNQVLDLNWHIEAVVNMLERSLAGLAPWLVINLPPRNLKSFLVSVCWPAFLLTRDPTLKIFCVSYSEDLAKSIARDFRRLVESAWYKALFPHVRWVKLTETEAITDQGGFRAALSVHGSITGRGADLIIIDDPSRPEDAFSEPARRKLYDWFTGTLLSRRDDKQRSGLIIVMQRLHVNDLTGFVEAMGQVDKLALPAIAPQDEEIPLGGGRIYLRRAGEVLQPVREGLDVLERTRQMIGAANFAAQYQQSPLLFDGEYFSVNWFLRVANIPSLRAGGQLCISIDSAQSTSGTADYTALLIAYIYQQRLYVLRVERARLSYEKLAARTMDWIDRCYKLAGEVYVVVEFASSGISLAQFLHERSRHDPRYRIETMHSRRPRLARAQLALPAIERGVYLWDQPGKNGWVDPFLSELMSFPNGAHDDQVDALVQLFHMRWVRTQLGIGS